MLAGTKTYKLTIDNSYFNTTSYAANNNEKTSYAVNVSNNSDTYEVKWTSNQVMKNSSNMQWQKSKGYIYNITDLGTITNVTVTSSAGTFTTYYGTSEQPNSGTTVGNGYFQIKVGSATGTTSKVEVTFEIPTHTLTYSATNGSISGVDGGSNTVASGSNVNEGATVTLTATPASGYVFNSWNVSGTGSTLSSTTDNPTTFTMGTANSTVTANFVSVSSCATPTFSVDEGTYNEAKSVELNCGTDDATIYYTTDGTNPTTSSSVYSSAIAVNTTTTIKAIAVKDGLTDSEIASATYTLQCITPTISVPDGVFLDSKTVTITSSDGANIYYTTDGNTPINSSTLYDSANKPSISATTTIKAIAIKDGWVDSDVATETFTKITPLTVGEALTTIAALAKNGAIANQYVSGVVSTTGSVSSGSVTYYISTDGTTTSQLQIYKGKNAGGVDFTNETNLELGDEVVVYGTLKNYGGTTPEFDSGSQVIKRVTKSAPTFTLDVTEAALEAYSHETIDVTLTTNTDGEISYVSSNSDVVTVAKKSEGVYTITAQTEGTATITISSATTTNYKPASAVVSVTVNDSRTAAGISFAENEIEKTWGESFTGQELTNTNSVAVTWSSTDETVATVNSTGVVEVLKAGTTTIKATFVGDATYKAAVASYTLTVNKANAGLSFDETAFEIMLNDESLVAPTLNNPNSLTVTYASNNNDVAVVDENTGELLYDASVAGTAKITATFAGNDWYKSGSANYTITIIDPNAKGTKYNPYTVAEVIDGTATGSNIYVRGFIVGEYVGKTTDPRTSGFTTDANIAIADVFTDSPTAGGSIPVALPTNALKTAWGNKTNSGAFLQYEILVKGNIDSYFSVNGIKSTTEVTAVSVPVAISDAGWATYCSSKALDFTDVTGLTAYTASKEGDVVKFNKVTGKVPANEGLLVKGATTNIPVCASASAIENLLVGVTVNTNKDANTIFVLKNGANGIGFYKNTNAFTVRANSAYLDATDVAGARTFIALDDEETTNIDLTSVFSKGNGVVYDLQGRRVAQPTKGLYIVNGKKIVIR